MKTQDTPADAAFEFSFPQLDTHMRVERRGEAVIIRATRDTFTAARRETFVRELAAEGFISSVHGWSGLRGVTWSIDPTWFMPSASVLARTRRRMLTILGAAVVLWALLMVATFQRVLPGVRSRAVPVATSK